MYVMKEEVFYRLPFFPGFLPPFLVVFFWGFFVGPASVRGEAAALGLRLCKYEAELKI